MQRAVGGAHQQRCQQQLPRNRACVLRVQQQRQPQRQQIRAAIARESGVGGAVASAGSAAACCGQPSRAAETPSLSTAPPSPASATAAAAAAAALALVVALGAPGGAAASEIYSGGGGAGQYEFPAAGRYAEQEAGRFDDYLQTPELRGLLELVYGQRSPGQADLDAARLKVGFRRAPDGRVSLQGSNDSHWYSIKADMLSPGFILVRDETDGRVLVLPPDESGRLVQVDLSDDAVVGQLFGSGAWQDVMEPLQVEDMEGRIVPLVLSESEFRNTMSLLEDAEEAGADGE